MNRTLHLVHLRRSPLSLALLALIAAAVACSLPGIGGPTPAPSTPQATPIPSPALPSPTPRADLPPALIQADPPPGSEIALQGPITLVFNQPMQRASVEAALRGGANLSGRFTWQDDATLTFQPDAPLLPETPFSLEIAETAQAANGKALLAPVSLEYRAVGYLRLTQALPGPGSVEVDPSAAVVAAFNRPVVPLGADPQGLPAAFSLEPAAAGRGEWLNTSTYIFYAEPALSGGTNYTVRLNPALQGLDGAPLEGAELPAAQAQAEGRAFGSWTFSTALPGVIGYTPTPERYAGLEGPFSLQFNQPMDPASVEQNLRLGSPAGAAPGVFGWNDDFTSVTFTPTVRLERNTYYSLRLEGAAAGAGGTPLGAPFEVTYLTHPDFAVLGSDPASGGEKLAYLSVKFFFSSPPQTAGLKDFIQVEPELPQMSVYYDDSEQALWVHGTFDPSADYRVTLSADLTDRWGQALGQPYQMTFRTQPLRPELFTGYGGSVLFMTTQDQGLPAQVINVNQVRSRIARVPLQDFFALTAPGAYDALAQYAPIDPQAFTTDLDLPLNRSEQVELTVSRRGGLQPGLYYLRLFASGMDYQPTALLVVSDVQLTFKIGSTDTLVWATRISDGTPLAGAPVTVYDEYGTPIASGETDADGVFRSPIPPQAEGYNTRYAMTGSPGEDDFSLALSYWEGGLAPWELGIPTDYRPPHLQYYFYTDRPIYRPGQTVYFRAVARQVFNGRYEPAGVSSLPLRVMNESGEELASFDLPLTAFGAASGEYSLPEGAAPGYYRLELLAENEYYGISFQVAEYRKPEIDLQVGFQEQEILAGAPLEAQVSARYFFDAPASDVAVNWQLYVRQAYFELPGYQVGPLDTRWLTDFYAFGFDTFGQYVSNGIGVTDAQGRLQVPVTPETVDYGQTFTLEASAVDEAGLPVAARGQITVHPADFYIGVRAQAWGVSAGERLGFDLLTVDWNRQPSGSRDLQARFERIEWVEDETTDRYALPTYTEVATLIEEQAVTTDAQGEASLAFTPPDPGTYRLTITGGGTRTETLAWVGGRGAATWPSLPNQRLRLTADQTAYQPGDTAQVFIPNPFETEVLALLTVERGVVFSHQVLRLAPGGKTVAIPLSEADAPNVYVSVTVLDGRRFRYGLVELTVAPQEQTLNVTLTSQPERSGPQGEVTFSLRVTDSAGQPAQGEFSLAVVDKAVLALADPNSQEIVAAFYGRQPLGVRTGLSLAAYTGRGFFGADGRGGGGGDGALTPSVREEFPDTAYWNGVIVTDQNGEAQVTVTLPDSLTTWQVEVRGLTEDTRVGQAAVEVVTTKDLLVRPVTPRFLVVGDHVLLAAVAQNNTANELQAQVTLQAGGFALDDPGQAAQTVALPAGGRVRVEWWGTAQNAAEADLVFIARAGDLEDAARPTWGRLPILRYNAPQTFGTAGVLDQAGERLEVVSLPPNFDPQGGELRLELAPSLAAGMLNALDALEHSRYECTEQTLSRFLPNLQTYRALQAFNLESPDLRARLERTLQDGLDRLLATQNEDGGWSWWPGQGQSDPYISAYVLFGLTQMQGSGVEVSGEAVQRAADYLLAGLVTPSMVSQGWQLDRLAFQAFALHQADRPVSQVTAGLYDLRQRLSPWARALLALTYPADSPQAGTLLSDLQAGAIRSATGVHWEEAEPGSQNMGTPVMTTAMVIYALAERDPAAALLPEAVRYVMAHRGADGAWGSTYESAWVLLSLTRFMQGSGELGGNFDFSAGLNGALLAQGQAGGETQLNPIQAIIPLGNLYADAPNALTVQRAEGAGRLYYSAHLRVLRPVEQITPLSRGLSLSRVYLPGGVDCKKEACPALESGRAGEQVQVRLTLSLPQAAYYLLVEDILPAGAEVLNLQLKTSQQGQGEGEPLPAFDARDPFGLGWGWWLFGSPQIYDDRIAWSVDYLPAGTYELVYTLALLQPGEFRLLPANAYQFYFPEVQGSSAGALFTIEP
jgi:hypothetical protein